MNFKTAVEISQIDYEHLQDKVKSILRLKTHTHKRMRKRIKTVSTQSSFSTKTQAEIC